MCENTGLENKVKELENQVSELRQAAFDSIDAMNDGDVQTAEKELLKVLNRRNIGTTPTCDNCGGDGLARRENGSIIFDMACPPCSNLEVSEDIQSLVPIEDLHKWDWTGHNTDGCGRAYTWICLRCNITTVHAGSDAPAANCDPDRPCKAMQNS